MSKKDRRLWVIFSIDNASDVHTLAKFLRHIDTQQALGKLEHPMTLLFDSHNGVIEQSFCLTLNDFDKWVGLYGWVDNQESVLRFRVEKGRCPCALFYLHDATDTLGNKWKYLERVDVDDEHRELVETTKGEAMTYDSWTYRPSDGKWWVLT